jgi:hypothetical protein
MRRLTVALAALIAVPAALAGGPSPGVLQGHGGIMGPSAVSYVADARGSGTLVSAVRDGAVVRSTLLEGRFGVPYLAFDGTLGGLDISGRTLVLGDARPYAEAPYRGDTKLAVLDTATLGVQRLIDLKGDFSFDALSPDGRLLYLIHHVRGGDDVLSYRVRAYDLEAGKLLPRVIADKRQAGWVMHGAPVSRTATGDGRWVYTLYQQGGNYPFVHALDAEHATAVCIGIPWDWADERGIGTARLRIRGNSLVVYDRRSDRARYTMDRTTFRVTAAS